MFVRKLINQEEFNELLNRKLFDSSIQKLLNAIAEYPERYIGIFRATKPKNKLYQNLSQSLEIKFGNATEDIIEIFLKNKVIKFIIKK